MDAQVLTAFFMWCTVLNAGLLMLTFLMTVIAGDFVYAMHSRFFSMPRETFNVVLYSFFGIYKLLVLVFNVVPWIALLIMG